MKNEKRFLESLSSALVPTLLFFLIHCGSATDTQQNVDDSISIPDGYAIYGTVDGQVVQIPEGQTVTVITSNNPDDDYLLESGEGFGLDHNSYSNNATAYSNDIQVSIYVTLNDPLLFGLDELHTLETSETIYSRIDIQFPGTDFQTIEIDDAIIYWTAFGTASLDTISGQLQVTLTDGRGILSSIFSGQLGFLENFGEYGGKYGE